MKSGSKISLLLKNLSKLTVILLICFMSFSITKVSMHNAKKSDDYSVNNDLFAGGNGTADAPFLISEASHLDNIREVDTFESTYYFRMTNDIDMEEYLASGPGYQKWSDSGFMPISNIYATDERSSFRGIFDGAGYEIRNLWINLPNESHVGLFRSIDEAVISNVKIILDEKKGINGGSYTGGIAGEATASKATIKGCSVTGKIIAQNHGENPYFAVVGGMFGHVYGYTIAECYVGGEISLFAKEGINLYLQGVGGIAGFSSGVVVRNCYTNVTISLNGESASSKYTGGIIGSYNQTEKIESCYSIIKQDQINPIAGQETPPRGGLPPVLTIDGSYFMGDSSLANLEIAGASYLSDSDAKKEDNYLNNDETPWNFHLIWGIFESDGYPYLKIFKNAIRISPKKRAYDGTTVVSDEIAITGDFYEERPVLAKVIDTNVSSKDVGEYDVSITVHSIHDYQVTIGKFRISKANIKVIAAPATRNIYASNPSINYSFLGFIAGENIDNVVIHNMDSITYETIAKNKRGTYELVISGSLDTKNYTFEYQNSKITLNGLYYSEIIGISVGSIVVVSLAAFCIVWFLIKKRTFKDIIFNIKSVFVKTNTVYIEKESVPLPDSLSPKEKEIATDLLKGLPRHEIADKHYISHNTLKTHIKKIYLKTNCQSQVEFISKYSKKKE